MVLSVLLHVALLLWAPPLTKPNTEEPVPPPLTAYLQSAPQPPAPHMPLTAINAVKLEDILCQIDSNAHKLHGNPFSLSTGG